MRALLVTNPKATATTPRVRDVIIGALSARAQVEVAHTDHRGHAIELGTRAATHGYDLVIALGGDGTVNEIVNGLLADGPRDGLPALAALPGGSANVFCRTLGLSNDLVDATGQLLEALASGSGRTIGLGRLEGRWFVFTAGVGFDAAVVHGVELRRGNGRKASPFMYAGTAIRDFYVGEHRHRTRMQVALPGRPPVEDAFLAIVTNTTPWTYYKDTAVQLTPEASYETGLDLFALRKVGAASVARLLWQVTRKKPHPHGRKVTIEHDLQELVISSPDPLPVQVDGDFAGELDRVRIQSVPHALRVIC
ncbi:diacylglycerol/lipid kinase family protein [Cumulibacter manganitolerans]|uniref:diacylglycerol/lipid kinase family protein n=1 Tax=Cumulibacter manganitolerans TaxID=1884992 RepID=UPI001296E76C|nr:diacylglycerol kinase family protein [Cumulibacter manganitolerans]